MSYKELFEAIDARKDEYVHFWEDVCNAESPTLYKKGVDEVGLLFCEKAKQLGFNVEVCEQTVSGNVVAITMNPDSEQSPISISGHMDTVHSVGSFGSPAARIENGRLYGPGAIDCKGGIVAGLYAMAALRDVGFVSRPIMLLLQSDEEISSKSSGKSTIRYICEKAKNSVAFLNVESAKENNQIVIRRKGILRYKFTVKGRANHSSRCFDAVNAICEASHKIIELEKMKDENGITCNCGVISGGTTANTVASECTFYADIRFTDKEHKEQAMMKVKEVSGTSYLEGSTCECELENERICMEYSEKNVALAEKINSVYEKVGFEKVEFSSSTGGSDAADVTACGIPCVDNLGVYGSGLHTSDEYGLIESLLDAAKRIAAICMYI